MNKNQVQEQISAFANQFGVKIYWILISGTSEIADVNGWDIGYEVSDELFVYYPDGKKVEIKLENLTPEQLNQILEEDSEHFQSLVNRDTDDMWDNLAFICAFQERIKYVHELQHTLRLCKIEKEIVV